MKEIILESHNSTTRICEWGNRDKPTIVCLHGLGSTSLSFNELASMMEETYHFIAVDLPGHGKTSPFLSESDYEIPNLVNWLSSILNEQQITNCHLLAHSWGGDIALHYTVKFPDRINKVVLLDGGYYIKKEMHEHFGGTLEGEIEYYEKDFNEYEFSSWEDFLKEEKKLYNRWSDMLEEASKDLMIELDGKVKFITSGNTARAALKSMYHFPTHLVYDQLHHPILLLQSTLPSNLVEIRNQFGKLFEEKTGNTVKKLSNTSHAIHRDKPQEVANEMNQWFRHN